MSWCCDLNDYADGHTPIWAYVFAPLVFFFVTAALPVGMLIAWACDWLEGRRCG